MPRLDDLSEQVLHQRLRQGTLSLRIGHFDIALQSHLHGILRNLRVMYGDYALGSDQFSDYHLRLRRPRTLHSIYRPQVVFDVDGRTPFKPLPLNQAFALFEWGLNWCLSSHAHQYLIVHAAVVEKQGRALILPAPPGAGKSTLCAALVGHGWRLLSDELTLMPVFSNPNLPPAKNTHTGRVSVAPLPRPISIKNGSIPLLQQRYPQMQFTEVIHDTQKGSVCHIKAPIDSVHRALEEAVPHWIVFPRYVPNHHTQLSVREKAVTFLELADQAFNFNVLGERGFHHLHQLVGQCRCFDFLYSDLDEAMGCFDELSTHSVSGISETDLSEATGAYPNALCCTDHHLLSGQTRAL